MPSILKHFLKPNADAYIFKPTDELIVDERPREASDEVSGSEQSSDRTEVSRIEVSVDDDPISFAKVQANALMDDARQEIAAYKEEARLAFQEELEEERKAAREEGYNQGFAEGMGDAMREAKIQMEEQAAAQVKALEDFLEAAALARNRLLDDSREEMKDLALAIAEKVIRVSLKNSSDILLRMVDAATDTHKRCEWAHIYVADCDVSGKAFTAPELTAALGHISDRIRVIPMADDESGTCIVELPDVILDASVSTQLGNIKEVLSSAGADKG